MGNILIKQFRHYNVALWPLLGPLACSREVHKELGGPVFSSPESTWFIALDDGAVVGFAAVRDSKQGYWIDYSYVAKPVRGNGVHKKLAAARDKYIKSLPVKPILVCCRKTRWPHYEKFGFKIARERGSWVYGEKTP